MCDSFSDSILDACLQQDPNAKVAIEAVTKSNMVMIFGEMSTTANINIEQIIRQIYDSEKSGKK